MRPFLEKDGVDLSAGAPPPSAVDFDPNNKDATLAGADGPVEFDRTFQPQAGQDEVFAEIQKFIAFAQEGYHCSVLSYGAAGTGKVRSAAAPFLSAPPRVASQPSLTPQNTRPTP